VLYSVLGEGEGGCRRGRCWRLKAIAQPWVSKNNQGGALATESGLAKDGKLKYRALGGSQRWVVDRERMYLYGMRK